MAAVRGRPTALSRCAWGPPLTTSVRRQRVRGVFTWTGREWLSARLFFGSPMRFRGQSAAPSREIGPSGVRSDVPALEPLSCRLILTALSCSLGIPTVRYILVFSMRTKCQTEVTIFSEAPA